MKHMRRSNDFQLYSQDRHIRWMPRDGLRSKRQAPGLRLAAILLAAALPGLSAWASTSADRPDMGRERPGMAVGQAPSDTAPSTSAAPAFASPNPLHDDEVPPAQADEIIRSPRFRQLAHELRCLVCQNQTLLDSHAPLAQDLRDEVVRLIASGRNDEQVKQYLVDRYGEFVLYRPSWSWQNALLWFGPVLMLLVALTVGWRFARRGRVQPADTTGGASPSVQPASHEAAHHVQASSDGPQRQTTPTSPAAATGATRVSATIGTPPSSHVALAEIDALLADDETPSPNTQTKH